MNLKDLWVGEYSESRGCFQSRPLAEALRLNIRIAHRKGSDGWIPVAIGARDHVDRALKVIRDAQTILSDNCQPSLSVPNLLPGVFPSGEMYG